MKENCRDDGDQPYVYKLENGKAKKQEVKTGITSGTKIEILEGISKEDKIIINPPESIKDGMEVSIK